MGLLPSLLAGLRAVCATFPDPRKGRSGNIAMADFGQAAFALFFMQSASFLSFQRTLEKGQGRSNCQTLFGIAKIPSDNYIRGMLDLANPALLRPCFERVEHLLAEPPLRQAFGRLGGRTLIAWDGTEYFCSQKLGCPHCLTRQRANGRIENYHTLLAATAVAPGHAKVVPPTSSRRKTVRKSRTANATPSSAGTIGTANGFARCVPSISATISSPASPSSQCWRPRATISSSPARKARTRHSTISSTEPSPSVTRKKSARARRSRRAVIAGSKAFRCATARTRRWSTGSGSRFSTATAGSNIPSPG